jgi:hypothetical protein
MSGIDGRHRIRHDREEAGSILLEKLAPSTYSKRITTGHSASYLVVAWSTMQTTDHE